MAKKKPKTKSNYATRRMQLIRNAAKRFYYWRYHEDNDDTRLITNKAIYPNAVPGIAQIEIEVEAQGVPFMWQCVTVTYCRDPWGKEYREFGFARTESPIRTGYDSLSPLLTAALEVAEGNTNTKLIYARGIVAAPCTKHSPDLLTLVKHNQKNLRLTDADIEGLSDYLDQEVVYMEYENIPTEDVDEQISRLMKEN